jgi:lipopolysaccharide export system protein LptA
MTHRQPINHIFDGHRIILIMVLCLFGLCLIHSVAAPHKRPRPKSNERVYLIHSDELRYDMFGANPDVQIVKGHVQFRHQGAHLWCDSAYFYQQSNSVKAFGHVRFRQGDTLSLSSDYADYDGQGQMMQARKNVVLKHRRQTLYTDSLNYDRLYNYAFFQEGGTLIDGKDKLVSDWGEYHLDTREAVFFYNVKLRSPDRLITTDTLHYDTRNSLAHVLGPSRITSKTSVVHTRNAYFNTHTDKARMFGRSTIVDKDKTITGDSLYYNSKSGLNEGYGNVIYVDKKNKNTLLSGKMRYNEKTGYGYATQNALAKDYSQKDTLYVHADSLKIYTFNINTDSVYRKVHAFRKVRAYRVDVQAVCDSLVFNSKDSCMTMYHDPIAWSGERQLLGEVIKVYMNDSTIRMAQIIGQALSIEKVDEKDHYAQISSHLMNAYFDKGKIRRTEAIGNVKSIYYPVDDKDSSLVGLNHLETDTMRMYLSPERKLERIWTNKFQSTMYPMTQIPPDKYKLSDFAWFNEIRPISPADVFVWRGKGSENMLKKQVRSAAPLQHLGKR